MADCIAIAPELPFQQQVLEFAAHLSRSLPNASDQSARTEFVANYENQVKVEEGSEVGEETRKEVVRSLAGKVGELRGGLEAAKEFEAENSHLLLQYLLSSTFGETDEYTSLSKSVVEGVRKGGEIHGNAGRTTRLEAACRILNNTYNYLAPTSSLRPTILLSLLSLLAIANDLSALPLTTTYLETSLSQYAIPHPDKISFLTSASSVYQNAGDLSKALQLQLLAIKLNEGVDVKLAEKAVILQVADRSRFEFEVVKGVEGKVGELAGLFVESDEVEAVEKGLEWVGANGSFIESAGVAGFTAESISRKIRLIAFAALAARSSCKTLEYATVAKALKVEASEVEAIAIDAIRSNLLKARLSQPTSTIRIQSVSSAATRRFGEEEWKLVERRLSEWKKTVGEARQAVAEAEEIAAQGSSGGQRRVGGQGQQQQQQQEIAAA